MFGAMFCDENSVRIVFVMSLFLDHVTIWRYKEVLPAYTHGEEHGNAALEAGQHRKEEEGLGI